MCGIVGVAWKDPSQIVERLRLEAMAATLRHRGPDGQGLHVAAGAGLGVQRLAIVDLETGAQPLTGEDGSVVVICNGEIYNAPELRADLTARGHRFRSRSDVEVIVHLYEDEGDASLVQLRGMFALAVWDARRRRLLLARDRLGIKGLCYAERPDGLWFASEYKALLAGQVIEPELDLRGLDDLLRWGFVCAPGTLLRGVSRLEPGETLVYENGRARRSAYWQLEFPPHGERPPAPPGGWASAVRGALEDAVRIHMRSDVPIGAYLSTGIDSSAVTALAARATSGPLQTFTLAFPGLARDELRRRQTLDRLPGFALANERAVCDTSAFDRYPEVLWHVEDPTASALEVPQMLLAEAASRRVKVVLTGEGSDELFGGYRWFALDRWLRRAAGMPLGVTAWRGVAALLTRWRWRGRIVAMHDAASLDRYRLLMCWIDPESAQSVLPADQRARWLGPAAGTLPADFRRWDTFDQVVYHELTVRLPNLITPMLDRASMARGVEARVPFLDHLFVRLATRVPPDEKFQGLTDKLVLRRALSGVLPDEVRRRAKQGLAAPYRIWLRGRLPEFAEELLTPARLRASGYFDAAAVTALRARYRETGRGSAAVLLAVLAAQTWDELFVRRRGRAPF